MTLGNKGGARCMRREPLRAASLLSSRVVAAETPCNNAAACETAAARHDRRGWAERPQLGTTAAVRHDRRGWTYRIWPHGVLPSRVERCVWQGPGAVASGLFSLIRTRRRREALTAFPPTSCRAPHTIRGLWSWLRGECREEHPNRHSRARGSGRVTSKEPSAHQGRMATTTVWRT